MSKKSPLNYFKHSDDFKAYKAGERIFEEGQEGHEMYVVKSGRIQLQSGNMILETVEAGGLLGEMALISEDKRSATALALSDSALVPIDRDKFRFLVQQTPDFALEVMKILAGRLRKMDARQTRIF